MGIQFRQIDNLQATFDGISGGLQAQITPNTSAVTSIASGSYGFEGWKYFTDNVDFSGAQGVLVQSNNIYTPNTVFAGSLKIGGTIASPRTSTTAPLGAFQVVGGASYFEEQVNIRNKAGISIVEGSITGGTGSFYKLDADIITGLTSLESPTFTASNYISGYTGLFNTIGVGVSSPTVAIQAEGTISGQVISGQTGNFRATTSAGTGEFTNSGEVFMFSGNPTGFIRMYALPDYTETGNVPNPTSGTLFRSGNHLMIM